MIPSRILTTYTLFSASVATWLLTTPLVAHAQPVRGLYINGEGGATFNQNQRIRASAQNPQSGRDRWHTGGIGIGSIGWGLGNGFRVELEGNYRSMAYKRFITDAFRNGHVGGRRQTYGFMANALFDLDVGSPWIFPYIGGGIGYDWTTLRTSVTAPSNQFNEQIGGTFGNFAYQAMVGLSFPMPWIVGLSAIAEYRFWTMLGPQSYHAVSWGTDVNQTHPYEISKGNYDTMTDFNHSLMLGLRYEFTPDPPPPTPTSPTTSIIPAPQAVRSYLVFFDWDKTNLTNHARTVIETAAKAAAHVALTRITVSGYTDNTSAHPGQKAGLEYNLRLSLRRAEVVKAELIRDGVQKSIISIYGYGEANPLIKTALNTREPQNRRVEIVFR
ncbi:MAG: OmpA family protein [Acetobacter sp.]|nr:OmpA family protein [Acetobacter sp.]